MIELGFSQNFQHLPWRLLLSYVLAHPDLSSSSASATPLFSDLCWILLHFPRDLLSGVELCPPKRNDEVLPVATILLGNQDKVIREGPNPIWLGPDNYRGRSAGVRRNAVWRPRRKTAEGETGVRLPQATWGCLKLEKARKNPSLEASKGAWPLQHLEF